MKSLRFGSEIHKPASSTVFFDHFLCDTHLPISLWHCWQSCNNTSITLSVPLQAILPLSTYYSQCNSVGDLAISIAPRQPLLTIPPKLTYHSQRASAGNLLLCVLSSPQASAGIFDNEKQNSCNQNTLKWNHIHNLCMREKNSLLDICLFKVSKIAFKCTHIPRAKSRCHPF